MKRLPIIVEVSPKLVSILLPYAAYDNLTVRGSITGLHIEDPSQSDPVKCRNI